MDGWNTAASGDEIAPALAPEPDWSLRYTRLAGYGVYAATVVSGLMVGAVPGDRATILSGIALVWSTSLFCALDARAHRVVFVQAFWRISSLIWPLSVLIHLLTARGKRGALTFALHGALLAFCAGTSAVIGSVLKH